MGLSIKQRIEVSPQGIIGGVLKFVKFVKLEFRTCESRLCRRNRPQKSKMKVPDPRRNAKLARLNGG